jgi:uncharacterized protein (DUF362 family)
MEENIVYLAETEDRTAFVKSVMEKFSDAFSKPQKVLVKPNVVSGEPYPSTTHPLVLGAVLDFLLERENQVVVADGTAVDALNSENIISAHPLAEVCRQHGIELQNVHKHLFRKVKGPTMNMELSELAFDCHYIISLPVLKSHQICRMTGALKNQFGLLRNRERITMHIGLRNLHKGIAEINSVLKPDLIIMDAVVTHLRANEKRHGATEAKLGFMLAGADPVAVDARGLELLKCVEPRLDGAKPLDIDYISDAVKLGIGSLDYHVEEIQGL